MFRSVLLAFLAAWNGASASSSAVASASEKSNPVITITDADDPANPVIQGALVADSTHVYVVLNDPLANRDPLAQDSVTVLLYNGADSVRIQLKEVYSENSSWFRSEIISISTTPGWIRTAVSPPQGDTLFARYENPLVPDDSVTSKSPIWSPWPSPVRSGFFRDCGGNYQAKVQFDRPVPTTSLPKQLISNGGFEYPVVDENVFYSSDSIGAWKVIRKGQPVNLTKRAYALPRRGEQSLDLNGGDSNSIQQTLATTPGQNLTLTFWWNTSNGCGTDSPKAEVLWNGVPIDTLPYRRKPFVPNWNQDVLDVRTKGNDVLTFRSLNAGPCGTYLDDISLLSLPAPVTLGPDTAILRNGRGETIVVPVPAAATSLDASRTILTIPLPAGSVPDTTSWTATGKVSVPYGPGTFEVVVMPLTDSVGPWITSVQIVENPKANPVDTLVFHVTEPILAPAGTFFLKVLRGGVPLPTPTIAVDTAWLADPWTGKWRMAVRGNQLQVGDSVILDLGSAKDFHGIEAANCPTLYRKLSLLRTSPELVSGIVAKDCGGGGRVTAVLDHELGPVDVAGDEILQNASFETPTATFYDEFYGRNGVFDGWMLRDVDIVVDTNPAIGVPRSDGNQSLDLNGSDAGTVWQVITPPMGSRVRFSVMYMAYGGIGARAGISWNGRFIDTLKQDISRNGRWDTARFDLISSGRDSLCLFGINGGPSGMLVDALSLRLLTMSRSSGTSIENGTLVLLGPDGDTIYRAALDTNTIDVALDNKTLRIELPDSAIRGLAGGRLSLDLDIGGGRIVSTSIALADSVGPWIDSAKIVENRMGSPVDTLALWVTEPIATPARSFFLKALRGGAALNVSSLVLDSAWLADSATGEWRLAVRGGVLEVGDSVMLDPAKIKDRNGNNAANCPSLHRELGLLRRPITTWPKLVAGAVEKDCGKGGHVSARLDAKLGVSETSGDVSSIREGRVVVLGRKGDTIHDAVLTNSQIEIAGDGRSLSIALPDSATIGVTGGTLSLDLDPGDGTTRIVSVALADSVGPWIDSAFLVENLGGDPVDTIAVWLDEPVVAPPRSFWLQALRSGATVDVSAVTVDSAWLADPNANRWTLAVRNNVLVSGDSLLLERSMVADLHGSQAEICPELHRVLALWERPPPVARAWIADADSDGTADQLVMVFKRALGAGESPDSVRVRFGLQDSIRTVPVSEVVGDSILRIRLTIPFPRTETTGSRPDGSGLVTLVEGGLLTDASLSDSVGPNLLSARLRYGDASTDSLLLTFSEPVLSISATGWMQKWEVLPADLGVIGIPSGNGSSWKIACDAGAVFPGDSVRPLAHGGFRDPSARSTALEHPWMEVQGSERPPQMAWTTDADGDGAVDHVTLQWRHSPRTRPSFVVRWPNGEGTMDSASVPSGSWILDADGRTATLSVGPFAAGVTSSPTTDLGRQVSSGTSASFPVFDSVAAVLISAKVRYARFDGFPDTLSLMWSEPIRWTGEGPLVHVRSEGAIAGVVGDLAIVRSDSMGAVILLDPSQDDQTTLRPGDLLRLSPKSAGTLLDRFGNAVEDPTRWVPVVFGPMPPRFDISFQNTKVKNTGWPLEPGPALQILVKSHRDRTWRDFETGVPVSETSLAHGLGPTLRLNQPLVGKAYLYDNQGTHVASVDLGLVGAAFQTDRVPKDARNQYQVRLQWNGRASTGEQVATGVYLLRLVLFSNSAPEGDPPVPAVLNKVYHVGWEQSMR